MQDRKKQSDKAAIQIVTRRPLVLISERREDAGRPAQPLVRKIAAIAVTENPITNRCDDVVSTGIQAFGRQ